MAEYGKQAGEGKSARKKQQVAVIGATGLAGQQFIVALQTHPWYEITGLAASARSAGKTFEAALRDEKSGSRRWWCREEPSPALLAMPMQDASELEARDYDLIFTGVESDAARELEPRLAKTTPVISTASAFRYEADVPVLIPGVNNEHARLLEAQQRNRGWKGFITPIPNCTVTGLAITAAPIHRRFGLRQVLVTSMQSVSGAGKSPGVIALDIIDNVIPYIPGEEEKVSRELGKLLGQIEGECISPAQIAVSATCTRVGVLDGHTEAVWVVTDKLCSTEDIVSAWEEFGAELRELGLPSAPERMIAVHTDPFRPQPRLDRDLGDGITTSVGRLRTDTAFPQGFKYVLVSHNTKMGASKGAVLVAEYLTSQGYIG